MPGLALVDALPDFSSRPRPAPAAETPPAFPIHAVAPRPTEADIAERVAFEVARAEASLRERLEREHAATMARESQAHEAELEALRAQLGAAMGETVTHALAEAEARLTTLTTQAAARILGAFVSADIQKRAIDELARAIREAMADREALRLRLRGPNSMREALVAALGERAVQVDFTEAETPDLVVGIEETQFETRIAEWSEALDAMLS